MDELNRTKQKIIEIRIRKNPLTEIGNGIGKGCTAALKISTIAFIGVAAIQLLNSVGYLSEWEQPAKRVMWMSIIIGGTSVIGGAIAEALCDDNADFLVNKLIEERQKVEKLERENYFVREQAKSLRQEIEIERKERLNRGDRLREKQRKIEELESAVNHLKQYLPVGSQILEEWLAWEELVKELWGTEYCVASCRNCRFLDASSFEGRYLICGIHPYGKNNCEDWEAKQK